MRDAAGFPFTLASAIAGVREACDAVVSPLCADRQIFGTCRIRPDQIVLVDSIPFEERSMLRPQAQNVSQENVPHPPIVSQGEWLMQRKALLTDEKALTRATDRVNAQRRRLPMVRIEKTYMFDGPNGKQRLQDLFEGRRQLIVYHFMFDPRWEKGCPGCTGFVGALGDLSMLAERETTFVLISRAPLEKLERYKRERGWNRAWYSSFGSDFNYDFHVTLDASKAPVEYNYRNQAEMQAHGVSNASDIGEAHGLSVFFRLGDDAYHTYSAYARGVESVTDAYSLLDRTPYGRQEDFEDSPAGWPQRPTYG
jgi:predicted dithiol-disulfide oxidoreductase (DUF899 family)